MSHVFDHMSVLMKELSSLFPCSSAALLLLFCHSFD